ncbi:T9SS type A sorting domain-containing protein [Dyadobacter jiangsuensis]|uniref:Putative secreted protein (Por secretion system target) n=1 Tax=Dyadobacter jiangsuensis TaxID=1591085 RepID=A0A2P8GFV8_9BACT|nr:T9SS type A sorting domain-containing protein [Dyadobacter jiangsuensis]PSL32874.1 putative secreted protein (Por secretion system target) [Dyadobacter jiangsuensis]
MRIKTSIALALCCMWAMEGRCQFVTGSDLYVKIGTVFSVDSLVLVPTEDLNLGNNYSLTVSHTAVPGNPNASIKKKYVFNNPVNFHGTLGIIYDPAELNGNTESLLELANSWSDESGFTTMSSSTRDLGLHYVSKDVADLDIRLLTLVNAQSALPVTLAAFDAEKDEKRVKLTWRTSFEANSDFFEIQRSRDTKNWKVLDRVGSAGESSQQVDYAYTDTDPIADIAYYRLKMIDRDGTFAFSQIRKVSWDGADLVVFPNPAGDRLEIDVKDWSKVTKVTVLNAGGSIVRETAGATGSKEQYVPLTGIQPGSYMLQIEYRDGSSERSHFVKY